MPSLIGANKKLTRTIIMAIKIIPDNQRLAELAGKPTQLTI
jgi:hypothetical protein